MKIARIVQTCHSHPSQWEGYLDDGRPFYIRYRFGVLSVTTVRQGRPLLDEPALIERRLDDGWDGHMEYADLRRYLAEGGIDAPLAMDDESKWHRGIVPELRLA